MTQHSVPTSPSAALRASVPLLGGMRLGFAALCAARPRQVAAAVGVREDQHEAAVPYVRALALRELVVGASAVAAYRRGSSGAFSMALMAGAHAFDAVVFEVLAELGTLEKPQARRATVLAVAGMVPESLVAVGLSRSERD